MQEFAYGFRVRLLLIDGYYYVYRSFFAIRDLTNSHGEPTNAIYGFVKTLRRMLKDLQPDLGAVVWDEGLPERRTQLQPQYKQQREEMPEPLQAQIDFIHEIAPLIGFQNLSLANTEADDLMASYAVAAADDAMNVVLATNDKDLFQLANRHVTIYSTKKTDLASPKDGFTLLDVDAVRGKWGVDPEQIADVLSLTGDAVDNIPGVSGLGPKTAASLLQTHQNLDSLMANLATVSNERIRNKLDAARDQIFQNREMVRLDTDLPLPVAISELQIQPRYPEMIAALETCEFKSLLAEIKNEFAQQTPAEPASQGELF